MPSWNTPRARMQLRVWAVSSGFVAMTKGRPTRKVSIWPMKMALKRSSPCISPTVTNMPAINMPATMATQLPRI